MAALTIPHNAYVLIGDGRKALILRNEGDAASVNLKVERVFKDQNASTHEQGADRPGRSHPAVGARRFAVEQTDWHVLEEHHFAAEIGTVLGRIIQEGKIKALIVVAPPRTLADLRQTFDKEISQHIIAEINKDLTNEPVSEIEKHLKD